MTLMTISGEMSIMIAISTIESRIVEQRIRSKACGIFCN